MALKLIKKTESHRIYQRGDNRYAVKDAERKPVNGEEKVAVLAAEGLIKVPAPKPAEEPVEEEGADESAETAAEGEADAE